MQGGGGGENCTSGYCEMQYSVQAIVLPVVSKPAQNSTLICGSRKRSARGCCVSGSRKRISCAAMLLSSSVGAPLAFT